MNYKKTKLACYYTYLALSSVFALPPLLFMTFRQMYGISFTLLGSLVLINFCTQLSIDLLFSFCPKLFHIPTALKIMPLLTSAGLTVYALVPTFFPQFAYGGLVAGTVLFSVAAGLCEVLLSPTVAALPSDNPERDMSLLHSLYAYGVVFVVVVSSLFLFLFGGENWMYLTLFWAVLPLFSCLLFCICPLPPMEHSAPRQAEKKHNGKIWLLLCFLCIFFSGATENTMTNWISSFLESGLGITKALGDIIGLCLFAVLLGLGRSLYAKYGKRIYPVLLFGMIGGTVCYLTVAFSSQPVISLVACVLVGLSSSMLWPGTLILMEEHYPGAGVTAYALMAAGGDLGSSVAPQLMGIVVDRVSESRWVLSLSQAVGTAPETLGMKTGMLISSLFPILGILVLTLMHRHIRKQLKNR